MTEPASSSAWPTSGCSDPAISGTLAHQAQTRRARSSIVALPHALSHNRLFDLRRKHFHNLRSHALSTSVSHDPTPSPRAQPRLLFPTLLPICPALILTRLLYTLFSFALCPPGPLFCASTFFSRLSLAPLLPCSLRPFFSFFRLNFRRSPIIFHIDHDTLSPAMMLKATTPIGLRTMRER